MREQRDDSWNRATLGHPKEAYTMSQTDDGKPAKRDTPSSWKEDQPGSKRSKGNAEGIAIAGQQERNLVGDTLVDKRRFSFLSKGTLSYVMVNRKDTLVDVRKHISECLDPWLVPDEYVFYVNDIYISAKQESGEENQAFALIDKDEKVELVGFLAPAKYFSIAILEPGNNELKEYLCMVPILFLVGAQEREISCIWPCLVFLSLKEAVVFHKRLYPNQKKILKKLAKRLLTPDENLDHQVVVLPLGNSEGCCPPGACRRPLYDVIDVSNWTTQAKKKGCIEGGHKVIRLAEKSDRNLVVKYPRPIPCSGYVLIDALDEMKRLLSL